MSRMPELRARALRLLGRREYSRCELGQKLAAYAESPEAVDRLLDALQAGSYLSDQRYAHQRVRVRAVRYGNQRLADELRSKGLDGECIAAALAESEDETIRCCNVWQKKFDGLPGNAEERMRQSRFLHGRGFSPEVIRRVLRGELE